MTVQSVQQANLCPYRKQLIRGTNSSDRHLIHLLLVSLRPQQSRLITTEAINLTLHFCVNKYLAGDVFNHFISRLTDI